jgi:hypothetical protein
MRDITSKGGQPRNLSRVAKPGKGKLLVTVGVSDYEVRQTVRSALDILAGRFTSYAERLALSATLHMPLDS